jgi:prevent-host-death family protein
MIECGVSELKAKLSEYLAKVEAGETVRITRHGKVVAVMQPAVEEPKSLLGLMKGEIWVAEDAFDPDPELEALFYEGDPDWAEAPEAPQPSGGKKSNAA